MSDIRDTTKRVKYPYQQSVQVFNSENKDSNLKSKGVFWLFLIY